MNRVSIAPSERHSVDYLADLYSVLLSLEKLEKARHRDFVTADQHSNSLRRLLDKYATIVQHLRLSVNPEKPAITAADSVGLSLLPGAGGIDIFLNEYSVNCPAARTKIFQVFGEGGVPPQTGTAAIAVPETSAAPPAGPRVDPKMVLEIGQHFITLMDCVKLQQTAVDQLHPILTDLLESLKKVAPEFEHLSKLQKWWETLNGMHATDVLGERDTRALAFDLERSYQSFHRFLQDLSSGNKK